METVGVDIIGRHLLAYFYGVASQRLDDVALLSDCLRSAASRSGLTLLGAPILHCFRGGGVTGFIVLAESHISFHTYPEHGFMALDIFSCGDADPQAALQVFRTALAPQYERVMMAERGEEIV